MPSLYPRIRQILPEISLDSKLNSKWPHENHFFTTYELLVTLLNENKIRSTTFKAKIDTGANISLFPYKYAKSLIDNEYFIDHDLYGVVRLPQCQVPVKITKLNVLLMDELGNEMELKGIFIALSELEGIPALIGMKNILENVNLIKSENNRIEMRFI